MRPDVPMAKRNDLEGSLPGQARRLPSTVRSSQRGASRLVSKGKRHTIPPSTEICVPASIANLGPGLDTLAVAVRLFLRLRVRKSSQPGTGQLHFHFRNFELKGENLIERAFFHLAGRRRFPSVDVDVETKIPLCSGLGSSAAAVAAGFRLFETLFVPQPIEKLLEAGCAIEGHPENLAAALLGGLVVCCQRGDGSVLALPATWPPSLQIVVATPDAFLETRRSRAVLPRTVPLASAVNNIQRVSLLLEGLRTRNYDAVAEGLRDRLHQPSRCAIVPALERCLDLRHRGLVGVCLSGSGPSVAALARSQVTEVAALLRGAFRKEGMRAVTRTLRVWEAKQKGA
jgi:homoserine kinase